MRVEFFGAAGEVTGSCHLVHVGDRRILLDCGMIQSGGRDERERNAAAFGFDPKTLDSMVLSHAHIDHVGRLPLLIRRGYRGPIHTQRATAELTRIMLEDAARLAASDVEHENRRRERRGRPALAAPYDERDVARVLAQIVPHPYGDTFELVPGVRARLTDAGHILGAAIVELWGDENGRTRKLVFSGDIGPKHAPLLRDPTPIEDADLVMLESTYGDRLHRPREDTVRELGRIFREASESGGNILIPAFAVGRSQEILYWLARHFREWDVGRWRVVLDSPMAARVTELYKKHAELFDDETRTRWPKHGNPEGHDLLELPNLHVTVDAKESQGLNSWKSGLVIIAGSGMCNGGRIRHHLRHHLWRESTHVIFAGYQAAGTLGRELVDGAPFVRIFGERIRVAAKRHTIGGLSAHADQAGLMEWYGHFRTRPRVYLVHGEDRAREALAARLQTAFDARVTLTRPGMSADV